MVSLSEAGNVVNQKSYWRGSNTTSVRGVAHTGGQFGTPACSTSTRCSDDCWRDGTTAKATIRAENELEANRVANNYKVKHRLRITPPPYSSSYNV